MSNKEILELVDLLKFDYQKHKNITSALKDLLKDENYDKVIRGKSADPKYLHEVQEIYEAYKKLKDEPLERIISVIKDTEELELEEENNDTLYEIVIYSDEVLHIKKKNKETGLYEEIAVIDGKIREYAFQNQHTTNPCIKRINNGIEEAYDLLGRFIVSGVRVSKILNGIYSSYNEKTGQYKYYDNNGKLLFERDNSIYSNNIIKIFALMDIDKITYKQVLGMLKRTKQYEFLNRYKVIRVNDDLMKLEYNGESAYYNFNGEEILSTLNGEYCYLGNIQSKSDFIIPVAKNDIALNKTYGYYDLKARKEIVEASYLYAFPWENCGLLIDDECPKSVFIDNGTSVILPNKIIDEKAYSYNLERRLLDAFRDKETDFFNEFREKNNSHTLRLYEAIINIEKIKDNLYLVYLQEEIFFIKKEMGKWQKCLKSLCNIGNESSRNTYNQLGVIIYEHYAGNECLKWRNHKMLFGFNEIEANINLIDYLISSSNPETEKEKRVQIANSAFSPKSLDTHSKLQFLLESKSLIVRENKNVEEALMVLVQNGLLEFSQIEDLLLAKKQEKTKTTKKIGILASENYNESPIVMESLKEISEDGNIILADFLPFGEGVLDRKTKRITFSTNYRIVKLYKNGQFLVKAKKENKEKYYILSTRQGNLFGPQDIIMGPLNGIYLCSNNDKWYAYDENGELVIKESDHIEWVKKYYINKFGFIIKEEYKLQVTNGNYVFLLDDDGDKLINTPKENAELLRLLNSSDEELLPELSTKKLKK